MTPRIISVTAALAALAVLTTAAWAQTAAAPAAQASVAMVDVQKAANEYKGMKAANEEINKLVADMRTELETRSSHKLMTEAELTELVGLKKKKPLTAAENQRVDELEKILKQRDEELNALSQKADPTETERARLRELKDLANRNTASVNSLNDEFAEQADKRKTELQDKVSADLLAAVAKVAQQKGLPAVIDKIAVLYGGVDITADVIKALNGG